jgi:hypothetical protein
VEVAAEWLDILGRRCPWKFKLKNIDYILSS